jgi:hypothetical protein
MMRKLSVCFLILFVFLFASCVSLRGQVLSAEDEAILYPVETYVPESFTWQEVVPGVKAFDFENPDLPLIYHAVKINLDKADLTLAASQWERTSDFAEREKCLAAMNATPFDKTRLAGIYKMNGNLLSDPVARYAVLGLRCGAGGEVLSGQIFESQTDEELAEYDAAFGGFFVVLKDGQVQKDFIRRQTSRSGAGLSADGKTLYLLVVEGERPQKSLGLSYPQCGEIFRAMGCRDALEFDGGGSSDLCIKGQSVLSYRVRRVQGNSIGFKVK